MEHYEENMLANRSRSIPRRIPHPKSWPSLQPEGNVEEVIVKIQANVDGIAKKEMGRIGMDMGRMQKGLVELQTQAAGIVRDVNTALQTLAVQQQLALTINQESQRLHQVANDQSDIAE